MAVPVFLGALIGIGASIFGGISNKKAAKAEAEATAEAARLNIQQVQERAKIETTLRQRAGQREAGTIAAAAGASGLAGAAGGGPTGSAADILRESARSTAFDVGTIRRESRLQAGVLEQEARGALKAGKARGRAALAGGIGSAASILTGSGIF